MGLDIVECIMRIEDEFGVSLDDEELSHSTTVGECYEMVVVRLRPPDHQVCITQRAFHRLRQAMVDQFDLARAAVTLDLPLEYLMPPKGRRAAWEQLGQRLGIRLPSLERSPRALASVVASPLVAPLPALACGQTLWALASVIPGYLAWDAATRALASEFPVSDVRGLCQTLAERNPAALCGEGGHEGDPVWRRIVEIIVEQVDIEPERVTYDARWVQDLQLD